jgi:hypothetical protein
MIQITGPSTVFSIVTTKLEIPWGNEQILCQVKRNFALGSKKFCLSQQEIQFQNGMKFCLS